MCKNDIDTCPEQAGTGRKYFYLEGLPPFYWGTSADTSIFSTFVDEGEHESIVIPWIPAPLSSCYSQTYSCDYNNHIKYFNCKAIL